MRTTRWLYHAIILAPAADQPALNAAAQALDPGMGDVNIWRPCNASGLPTDPTTHYLTTSPFTAVGWAEVQALAANFPSSSLIPWDPDTQPTLVQDTLAAQGLKFIQAAPA